MNSFQTLMMTQAKPVNLNAYNPANPIIPKNKLQHPSTETEVVKVIEKPKKIINLKYIIENKPPVKVVRKYMRNQIESIKSPEAEMFEYDL